MTISWIGSCWCYDRHPQVQKCVKALNHLYRSTPALYEVDKSWNGFQWITANDSDNSVLAFLRTDAHGGTILCVINFTPVFHPIYRVGLPQDGSLNEFFNTDRAEFGGSNHSTTPGKSRPNAASSTASRIMRIFACRR